MWVMLREPVIESVIFRRHVRHFGTIRGWWRNPSRFAPSSGGAGGSCMRWGQAHRHYQGLLGYIAVFPNRLMQADEENF